MALCMYFIIYLVFDKIFFHSMGIKYLFLAQNPVAFFTISHSDTNQFVEHAPLYLQLRLGCGW